MHVLAAQQLPSRVLSQHQAPFCAEALGRMHGTTIVRLQRWMLSIDRDVHYGLQTVAHISVLPC